MKENFPNYEIIKNYVYRNFELAYHFNSSLENYFVKNDGDFYNQFQNIFNIKPIFFKWKDYLFPVFIHQNERELFTKDGKISFDLVLNIFLFLSGWQELVCTKKDKHNRFPYKESLQFKHNFTDTPVVNIYFELLLESIKKDEKKITPTKFKDKIIFTHDIDQLRSGWFENIQYYIQDLTFKNIKRILFNFASKLLGNKDDYFNGMEKMLAIDAKNNLNAISFFIPTKSHLDADFDIKRLKYLQLLNRTQETQEIGIHPGYHSFDNLEEYQKQLNELEKLSNQIITKSRQHFLRYDIKKTPFIQEKLQIQEDYTLGFAEHYGFRNGIANPFYLFNFEKSRAFTIKQFPLVFMDVTLTNYELEKDFDKVLSFFKKTTNEFNCHFSILFHNSVFSNGKYKGFEAFYKEIFLLK